MSEETFETTPKKELSHDATTGAVKYGETIIGEFDGEKLTLQAGWCRLAGIDLEVLGDTSDRRRVLFKRGSNDHRLASEA